MQIIQGKKKQKKTTVCCHHKRAFDTCLLFVTIK